MTSNLIDNVVHEKQVSHQCDQEEGNVECSCHLCIDNFLVVQIDNAEEKRWLCKNVVKLCICRAAQVKNCCDPGQVEAAENEEVDGVAGMQLAIA